MIGQFRKKVHRIPLAAAQPGHFIEADSVPGRSTALELTHNLIHAGTIHRLAGIKFIRDDGHDLVTGSFYVPSAHIDLHLNGGLSFEVRSARTDPGIDDIFHKSLSFCSQR